MKSTKQHIANSALIGEALSLLEEGKSVTLMAAGDSMRPFIKGGRDKVVLEAGGGIFSKGDVVLACLKDGSYVLHRVFSVDKEKDLLTLMGDGNLRAREFCSADDVKAVAVKILRKGRVICLNSKSERFKARLWRILLPLRRLLLKILP